MYKKPSDPAQLVSDAKLKGTHDYNISPNGKYATHSFSNYYTPNVREWIILPDNKPINPAKSIAATMKPEASSTIEYTKIKIEDNVVLDAWINKPKNFDPSKKYPVVF